jgi:CubicO group peptidase (beta-lactamase class C family)
VSAVRRVLAVAAAAGLAAAATVPAGAAVAGPATQGRYDRPRAGFMPPSTILRDGDPADVGLDPEPIAQALATVRDLTQPDDGRRPLQAGAVTVLGHQGVVVGREAAGWALRYADGAGTELPRQEWVPVTEDTVFDLASVSKLFTSVVVMQQVEAGRVDLDTPVAAYVPEFGAGGKDDVTVRHLLTHTGGLPAWAPLWRVQPDRAARIRAALTAAPVAEPGARYLYSDLGMITLGELAERVTGQGLAHLVRTGVTEPLGMADTGYRPAGDQARRAAATEFQATPPRGLVRGEVHDENAWSLGGVAGHAGVFSTAADLSVLAQALLNGGTYGKARILHRHTVEAMITDENTEFPGNAHGLGFELDQRWYMDALSGPRTAGHTGFTGPSIVLDVDSGSFAILLANRVHPSRSWGSNNPTRRAVARGLALALDVPARHGVAWEAVGEDARTSILQVGAPVPEDGARVAFDLFVDTEESDRLAVEASVDGGATWVPVPLRLRDRGELTERTDGTVAGSGHRRWWQADADLPAPAGGGSVLLRWRYTTDALHLGRGVLVRAVRVVAPGAGLVLDGDRDAEAFLASGWRRVDG